MDNTHPFSKESESLLASDSEDQEFYTLTRRKLSQRITGAAALSILNVAFFLATMIFWLSPYRYDGCVPRLVGAGDVQDAIDAHAIEYEVRSYSKPLDYSKASRKAVISNSGDRDYSGLPSLETDAAWDDLLRNRFIEMTPNEVEPFKPQLKPLSHSGRYSFVLVRWMAWSDWEGWATGVSKMGTDPEVDGQS